MDKLAYTPNEACEALGVKRTFIFNAMRDGRLERRKAGARTLIPAESLKNFLAGLPRDAAGRKTAACGPAGPTP